VLCFGKSQQGFTLACSRLTSEVCCVAFVKASLQWTERDTGVHANVWQADSVVASQ